jgi:hypothetical protein
VVTGNLALDAYNLGRSEPDAVLPVRLPERAVVVEACPRQVAEAVGTALRDAGVAFRRQEVGDLVAFHDLRRIRYAGDPVAHTIPDPGQETVEVRLGSPRAVSHVVVECAGPLRQRLDRARLRLETSPDGQRHADAPFRLIQPAPLWTSGSRVFAGPPDTIVLQLAPGSIAALRIRGLPGQAGCAARRVRVGEG